MQYPCVSSFRDQWYLQFNYIYIYIYGCYLLLLNWLMLHTNLSKSPLELTRFEILSNSIHILILVLWCFELIYTNFFSFLFFDRQLNVEMLHNHYMSSATLRTAPFSTIWKKQGNFNLTNFLAQLLFNQIIHFSLAGCLRVIWSTNSSSKSFIILICFSELEATQWQTLEDAWYSYHHVFSCLGMYH